jgi:pre-mRNA-processing factor 40
MSLMKADRRTASIDPESLTLIFERLRDKAMRRSEDDKHHAERQQRRAVDALRSRIKRLEPPVRVDDTWEEVRPRLEKLEEFRALDSEDLRRSAFDKTIRRLKDKEDYDRDRGRRDRDYRDRDRDRDREYRNGHHSRRHRTRSPEPDAYEADRKKAQADRERLYRKSSTGLSPPRRERDDRDRYVPRGSHYDRERREREVERERTYSTRADPRDRPSELDYGDGSRGSTRRRRDSDDDSLNGRRDVKVCLVSSLLASSLLIHLQRSRRDRSRGDTYSPRYRSKTPQSVPPPKEDAALRSGSEEGEIEED